MNDADVSKQIQQMVRFIRQEAEEKANEISVSSEEEFNIEKLEIVEAEKRKMRQEFERKDKQVDTRKKIEYSMQLNASRIKFLQAQDQVVSAMKDSASKELLRVAADGKTYRQLLKMLILQGLMRLMEPAVLLRCREMDRKVVDSLLPEVKKEFGDKVNMPQPLKITLDSVFLPSLPSTANTNEPYCSGGVVLASQDGKIVCDNTLDARLDVAFRQKLPQIRKQLLG